MSTGELRRIRRLWSSPDRRRHLAALAARLADRVLPHGARIARLTVAAVFAHLLAQALIPGNTDLTGPLTALLVVQATATGSLRSGLGRVAAVLTGVLVAIVVSTWVGLTWWSLGIVIAAALALAYAMKLGDHILETPISAMLILGVAQHDVAATTRIVTTLIGAGVGMAFNLAFPPPVTLRSAEDAIRSLAGGTARVLRIAGEELDQGVDRRQIEGWLDDVHALLPLVAQADAAIAQARDTRRLNPRALVSLDALPVLRHGASALDRTLLAVRQTLLSFQKEAPGLEEPDDEHEQELRRAFAVVLTDMGDSIEAYGELTIAEAQGREDDVAESAAQTLEILRETRAMLTELCLVDPKEDTSTWLLHGSILGGIEAVLSELDMEARVLRTRSLPVLKPFLDKPGQVMTRLWVENQDWTPFLDTPYAHAAGIAPERRGEQRGGDASTDDDAGRPRIGERPA